MLIPFLLACFALTTATADQVAHSSCRHVLDTDVDEPAAYFLSTDASARSGRCPRPHALLQQFAARGRINAPGFVEVASRRPSGNLSDIGIVLADEDGNASVSPTTDGTVLSFVSANLTRSLDYKMDITGKANITDEQIFENMLNNTGNIQHAHLVLQMINAKPKINAKPTSWAKKRALFDNTADSKHRKLPMEKVVDHDTDHDTDDATHDTDNEQENADTQSRQRNMLFFGGSVALPILFLLCASEGGHMSQKANSPRVDGPDDDYWAEKYEVGG